MNNVAEFIEIRQGIESLAKEIAMLVECQLGYNASWVAGTRIKVVDYGLGPLSARAGCQLENGAAVAYHLAEGSPGLPPLWGGPAAKVGAASNRSAIEPAEPVHEQRSIARLDPVLAVVVKAV